jgi:dihydroorotate dehydrogenase
VPVDLTITADVHTYEDVLKGLMAGSRVTMMTSELIQNGLRRVVDILPDVTHWLEEHEY